MGPIICAHENPIYNVVHFTLWYHIWNQSLSPSAMNNCSHMCIGGEDLAAESHDVTLMLYYFTIARK